MSPDRSDGPHRPTIAHTRRWPAALVAMVLAWSGAVGSAGPASADPAEAAPMLPALSDVLTIVGSEITPVTVTAGGNPLPAITVSGLPAGLSATGASGQTRITGVPTAVGTSTVVVTAGNGTGDPVSGSFTLVVGTRPTVDIAAAAAVTVGESVHLPIAVTGYPAPVVTADGLPAGLTVSKDGDRWALTGTPTGPDLDSATVTVTGTNGLGGGATASIVLTATRAPAISGPSTLDLPSGADLGGTVRFTGTGFPVPVMGLADGQTLPPGLTMTDVDGELRFSGTPTGNGVWNLTVVATNLRGTSTHAVRVTVGSAPSFAEPEQTITIPAGAWMDVPLVATSSPSHSLTIVGGALPPGVRLEADGSLTGYTRWDADGRYTVQVEARNIFGVDTMSLTIDLVTRPTLAVWEPELVGNADQPMDAEFTTVGWTPPTVTLLDPLPAGLVLTHDESTPHTWRVTGTVAREDCGNHSIRVSLDNGYGAPVTSHIVVRIYADALWSIPSETTVTVEKGKPITPVHLTLTGHPLPTGWWFSGQGLRVESLPSTGGAKNIQITGEIGASTQFSICGVSGPLSCTTPRLKINFVAQERPRITTEATVTAAAGELVSIPVTVTGAPASTLTVSGLPPGLSVAPAGTGAWAITGTTDRTGLGQHTLTLTADNGLTQAATITLTVTGAPEIVGPVTVAAPAGVPLSGTAVVTTGHPVATTTLVGELPPGLTTSDDGGVLTFSGTPTDHGVWKLTVVATNTEGTASHDVVVTVGSAPVFTEASMAHGVRADAVLDTQLLASSWPGHTMVIASGTLPPGMTLTADGRLFGSAGTTAAGRHELTVQATNAFGVDTMRLTIDVLTRPDLADGLPALTMTSTAGTPVTYGFTTSGWDPPTVTALDPLPEGLTLARSADHTWRITGTPTRDGRGSRIVRLELTNDYGTAVTRYLSIAVAATPVWDQPSGRTIIVERGVPIDPVRISATGYELYGLLPAGPAGPGLRFTADSWTSTTASGWITGTPTGSGSFSACIVDRSLGCYGPTLVISFHVQDRPAITAPAVRTALSDTLLDIPVTVNGSPAATVTVTGLPTGLGLVEDAPGEWRITGSVDRSTFGTHDVWLTADNGLRSTHHLTLIVGGVPAMDATTVTTHLDQAAHAVVHATGGPLPTLTVTGGTLPPGLSAAIVDGSGSLTFIGTPTSPGRWDVTVTATSTHGTDSATVTVEVRSAPAFDDSRIEHTLREGDPVDFSAHVTGYPTPTVGIAAGTLPAGLTLSPSGRVTGTPEPGSAETGSGLVELVLRSANAEGEDTLQVTLVLLSPPDLPGGLPTMVIDVDRPATYTFTTSGWDRPAVTLLDPLPAGLALTEVDPSTWQITGTVSRSGRGPHTVRVALDNAAGRVVETLHLEVHAPLVWGPVPTQVVVETGVPITPLHITATGYPLPTIHPRFQPAWMTWTPRADTPTDFSVTVEGTPPAAGPSELAVRTSDSGHPRVTVTFLVTDRPLIDAPAAQTVLAEASVDIPVTVNGSPAATVTATGLPDGLQLVPGSTAGQWRIVGTPTRDSLGDHTVTLAAENGLTATHTLELDVREPFHAPVLPVIELLPGAPSASTTSGATGTATEQAAQDDAPGADAGPDDTQDDGTGPGGTTADPGRAAGPADSSGPWGWVLVGLAFFAAGGAAVVWLRRTWAG